MSKRKEKIAKEEKMRAVTEAVAETDKGIASQPLAALHALEQEARREWRELQERRYRRIEIGGYVEGFLHVVSLSILPFMP